MPTGDDRKLQGHRGLKIYQLAYRLAMRIFTISKRFPPEERYSLTDQVRRSSRGVAANIAEGLRKRRYPNFFLIRWQMQTERPPKLRSG